MLMYVPLNGFLRLNHLAVLSQVKSKAKVFILSNELL
jgi:hypothetical protein